MLERNQKVAICRNTFRVIVGQKKKDKFVRYCPSIEGGAPAFKHSSSNLYKCLDAGFKVYQKINYGTDRSFSEEPFRQQFPNNPEISAQRWRHTYKALRETLRSFNLDPTQNWTQHRPFLLSYLGLYQGWVDPNQVMPEDTQIGGRQDHKSILKFVEDLYPADMNEAPVAPALVMRTDLNGLNSPSAQGQVGVIPNMENSVHTNYNWSNQQKSDASNRPTSHHPAPVMGELNNVSPPMFIDHDPNVFAAFEAVIYIQVEGKSVDQLQRNRQARNTRYDTRNDPAWHRRADQAEYQVMNMVKYTEAVQYPVKSLDELKLVDSENVPISQDYLNLMIDYLNGRKFIPGSDLCARNTFGATVRSQKQITRDIDAGKGTLPEDVRREQNRAYHSLDKTNLTMIMMANRMHQARVGIVFVTSGTGMFSSDLRKNMCLTAEIPHAILKDRKHFKQLVDHFQLKSCQKPTPRYIDYLNDGAAIFLMTIKKMNGQHAFRRTSAAKIHPCDDYYTEEQVRLYQKASNGVDICTNLASWVVLRKDEHLPAVEYMVALEGSAEMWSHWAHVTNLVEDYFERPAFGKNAEYMRKQDGGLLTVPKGAFKRISMLRDDCKMRIVNCVADLEVEKPDTYPFKMMRYPVEDGNAIQGVIRQRASNLQTKVSYSTNTFLLTKVSQLYFSYCHIHMKS